MFGDDPGPALARADEGSSRAEIQGETGQVLGVHDCSLVVEEGEILVLMGLSGSGKSTLLRAVNALNPVVRGHVEVRVGEDMVNVTEARGAALRRLRQTAVTMVFQQFGLLPWRSVHDNVGFGLELAGVPPEERQARVDRQLALVGLSDRAGALVGELSGGMQQRVALARCLANDPDVILMDEPLGALDALTREKMQGLVLKLWKETGKTIILITHSVEEALLLGERLVVMAPRPGRIHREYRLPFAEMGVNADLREVKKHPDFAKTREEILSMIWDMEEEIMGRTEVAQ